MLSSIFISGRCILPPLNCLSVSLVKADWYSICPAEGSRHYDPVTNLLQDQDARRLIRIFAALKKGAFISLLLLFLAPVVTLAVPADKPVTTGGELSTTIRIAIPVPCPDAELVQGTNISLPGLPAQKTTQRLPAGTEAHDWELLVAGIGLFLKESSLLHYPFNNHLFFIYPTHNFW